MTTDGYFLFYSFLYRHARTDTQTADQTDQPTNPLDPPSTAYRRTTFAFSYTCVIVELMVPLLLLVGWTII